MPGDSRFSVWKRWDDREQLPNLVYPGIYVLAVSAGRLHDKSFSWREDIAYVGMSNAVGGLAGRMRQFDLTISGARNAHGGADRFRFRYRNYGQLIERLFVAVRPVKCDVRSNLPRDLRLMGRVAQLEYLCLAGYVEAFGVLPEFNDKSRSPKYSRTVGR